MYSYGDLPMQAVNSVNFYGYNSESTGSIAKQPTAKVPYQKSWAMESTGSIGFNPTEADIKELEKYNDSINFRSQAYMAEPKKEKNTLAKTLGVLALLTVGVIGGLGYAHKSGAFDKLGEGWLKKALGWLEPAGKKCRGWCSTVKTKGNECIKWVKGLFNKK